MENIRCEHGFFSFKKDYIFIPIKGNFYDGHDFISCAIKSGALLCFSEKKNKNKKIINIKSSNDLIYQLANSWNKKSKAKVIAITGSNGKTTTVNLLHNICTNAQFNSMLGGNVGIPFSENVLKHKMFQNHVKSGPREAL